jgi:hypothetical protein
MTRRLLSAFLFFAFSLSGSTLVKSQVLGTDAPRGFVFDCGKEGVLYASPRSAPPQTDDVIGWCAISRKDVQNSDGQVITGIGVYPWMEGTNIKVRVFTMVPAPGAPNAWHGAPTDVKPHLLVQAKKLADYTLAFGDAKLVEELKSWGVEPMTVKFTTRPDGPLPR